MNFLRTLYTPNFLFLFLYDVNVQHVSYKAPQLFSKFQLNKSEEIQGLSLILTG